MQIIDAHHHYWDPVANYHPWLRDEPMIPFRYGNYSTIRQPFLPTHYDVVSTDWEVLATVTVEGEWDPTDALGEAHWIQQLANETERPIAHVAQAWLDQDDFPTVLDELIEVPVVRSVRHKPRANPRPGGAPGGMLSAPFLAGYRALGKSRLHFDLQTPWWHLPELQHLTDTAPDTRIIINHTGLPADRSPDALSGWSDAMRIAAAHEQVSVKISGLGLPGQPWTAAVNRDVVLRTIDCFGPERCLFASNFPVDGLCASFDEIFTSFDVITSDFSSVERRKMFVGNAAEIYQVSIPC